MRDNSMRPYCPCCDDFYVIRDRHGELIPCPACVCPVCQRLKNTHVDLGGCTCCELQEQRIVVDRSPILTGLVDVTVLKQGGK